MAEKFCVAATKNSVIISSVYPASKSSMILAEYSCPWMKTPKNYARSWRREIKKHLAKPGSTLLNYPW